MTQKLTVASAIVGLALFGAACEDDVEGEVGDVGEQIEQEVGEGGEGEGGGD